MLAPGLQRWSISHLALGHIIASHYIDFFFLYFVFKTKKNSVAKSFDFELCKTIKDTEHFFHNSYFVWFPAQFKSDLVTKG